MLAGRQGLIAQVSEALGAEKIVFAYSLSGLFLGYVYFSIPRCVLTLMAAAEKRARAGNPLPPVKPHDEQHGEVDVTLAVDEFEH